MTRDEIADQIEAERLNLTPRLPSQRPSGETAVWVDDDLTCARRRRELLAALDEPIKEAR